MDFFHWTTKIVSRNKGKSAVAASAYISGTRMENTWDGVTHDYTRKKHVIYTEVMLPPNAPREYFERIATGKMKGKTSDSDDEHNTLNYYKLLIDVQTDEDVKRANVQYRCEYKRGDHGMI